MATVLFVGLQTARRSQISQARFDRAAASRYHALPAGRIQANEGR